MNISRARPVEVHIATKRNWNAVSPGGAARPARGTFVVDGLGERQFHDRRLPCQRNGVLKVVLRTDVDLIVLEKWDV